MNPGKHKKVSIIGLGYIGLPTALISAHAGYKVHGYDVDCDRVEKINEGNPVIAESHARELLKTVLSNKNFHASTTLSPADYFIIAVPTPCNADKKADLSFLWNATNKLADVLKKGNTVILESTVPVGTTERLATLITTLCGLKAGTDFSLAYCPERVLPGKIFDELLHNPRIIGGIDDNSGNNAQAFYTAFVKGHIHLTTATTAEMVKLVENSSRDAALAFAQQVATLAAAAGLNPYEIIDLANKHPRVNILNPRSGVGGHCIAVDPWFLIEGFPQHTPFLQAVRSFNDQRPHEVLSHIKSSRNTWLLKTGKSSCTLGILGITYKPDTDDLRESPALFIAQQLTKEHPHTILVDDPHIDQQLLKKMNLSPLGNLESALNAIDILVCLVDHTEYKAIRSLLKNHPHVLDFCGLLYKAPHVTTHNNAQILPSRKNFPTFQL
jgi:UDP-N-acetyl-D-mannosaminuronic acid dehydrogenase